MPGSPSSPERRSTHWGEFLRVRMEMIAEWTDEGRGVAEIVQFLSVDPGQIRLLQWTIAQRRVVAAGQETDGG